MRLVWPSASNPHHLTMLTNSVAQTVSLVNPSRSSRFARSTAFTPKHKFGFACNLKFHVLVEGLHSKSKLS